MHQDHRDVVAAAVAVGEVDHFGGGFRPAPTYRRAALLAGNRIIGPALIEEHASTTVLMPGDRCDVDAYGNLVIAVGGARRV